MKKIIFPLAAGLLLAACNTQPKEESSTEKESPKIAAFPLSNLDTTVSPCEDFYQYAIGGWLKANPIPSTESRWSSFNVVRDSNNAKLKKILLEFSSGSYGKGSIEQQIGDFYKSAMDSTKIEELGMQPIQAELDRIDQVKTAADVMEIAAHHRMIGVGTLNGIYIGQDDKNSERYITHLYQSGLGLPDRDYYLKDDEKSVEIQQAYLSHLGKMLTLSGIKNADATANTIYNLEKKLATRSMTRVERRDPEKTYNKYAIADLSNLGEQIDWKQYFSNIGLENVDEVIVSQPDFLKGMNEFLQLVPIEDWKAYLKWKLIDAYANDLSSAFEKQNFEFYGTTLSGRKEMKPRWERALNKVNGNLGQLLGKAFVERHFPEEAKADVSQMVENLRTVFRQRINGLEWMSEETKKKAIEKLEAFNKKIGYPDKWRDYSSLEITADNQVQNVMNANKFNFEYMINKLGKPVDKDEWAMSPQTVNAYYSSSKNEIVFPAGILQPPFYSPDADDALNYGGIGAVIGHEFTHGFDDQGSKYDAKGNLESWWTNEDRERFDARTDVVVKQFDAYEPLEGLHVNGQLTLGENIADLGGATLAYYALEEELEKKGKPEDIDGFTYQQRFFLGWAQVWHMNMTEQELRKRIATDPHSPGEYRVKGPLANMSEFAKAFGCSEESFMVNTDSSKAVIW
jgi:putative endopeptidase